jgi:hypothetical protein
MTRKWRMTEHFRGPTKFGTEDDPVDSTWYGDTSNAVVKFDASADELYFDGCDLWLKDNDQLEFGDSSDVIVDWDSGNSQLLVNIAEAGQVQVARNLTSGATNSPVVLVKQDNASDDQAALTVEQDATAALAVDANNWCDIGYTTSALSGEPDTGAIRVVNQNSKYWIGIHTGSGTYRYVEFSTTTTA